MLINCSYCNREFDRSIKRINQNRKHGYKNWRISVFKKDNYTCQICSRKSGDKYPNGERVRIEADHIKKFADYPEFRFDLNNGRTLCKPCHRKTPTYGNKAL